MPRLRKKGDDPTERVLAGLGPCGLVPCKGLDVDEQRPVGPSGSPARSALLIG